MSIRFLADADLNQAIVTGTLDRESALDFLTAAQAGLQGKADPDVLEFAASQGRILVSHDTSIMPAHFDSNWIRRALASSLFANVPPWGRSLK